MIHELALAISEELKLTELAEPHPRLPDAVATGIGQLAAEAAFEGAQQYKWLVRP